jgi:hypothetical protein
MGPFMDDVIAGLIGGVSANMYTRGMAELDDGGKDEKTKKRKRHSSDVGGVIAG